MGVECRQGTTTFPTLIAFRNGLVVRNGSGPGNKI